MRKAKALKKTTNCIVKFDREMWDYIKDNIEKECSDCIISVETDTDTEFADFEESFSYICANKEDIRLINVNGKGENIEMDITLKNYEYEDKKYRFTLSTTVEYAAKGKRLDYNEIAETLAANYRLLDQWTTGVIFIGLFPALNMYEEYISTFGFQPWANVMLDIPGIIVFSMSGLIIGPIISKRIFGRPRIIFVVDDEGEKEYKVLRKKNVVAFIIGLMFIAAAWWLIIGGTVQLF